MKWIKCSERMPKETGEYMVLEVIPETPGLAFFKKIDSYKRIRPAAFIEKRVFKESNEETITYSKVKKFYTWSALSQDGVELENLTHWLEVSLPEEE